jgi:hypothetical protein
MGNISFFPLLTPLFFNRKQTVDLLIFHESFDFISFPIFLPCNKKLQEHWVIKLNIQTIK